MLRLWCHLRIRFNFRDGFAAGCEAVATPRRSVRIGLGYALGSGLPFHEWMWAVHQLFSCNSCPQVGRARTKGKAQIDRQADRRGIYTSTLDLPCAKNISLLPSWVAGLAAELQTSGSYGAELGPCLSSGYYWTLGCG